MPGKKTLVIGASTNPSRYSYKAIKMLRNYGHEVVALGLREGVFAGVGIIKEFVPYPDIDTVTLYVGPKNQEVYYDYIINLNPKRVIFNPGTENFVLEDKLEKAGIEVKVGCTLVLLSKNQY